jgi:hypothetical protein
VTAADVDDLIDVLRTAREADAAALITTARRPV